MKIALGSDPVTDVCIRIRHGNKAGHWLAVPVLLFAMIPLNANAASENWEEIANPRSTKTHEIRMSGADLELQSNEFSGTVGLEVPFPLPPARGSNAPQMGIRYSRGSNGLAENWDHGVPCISANRDLGIPAVADPQLLGQYAVVTSGSSSLLVSADPAVPGATEFRERRRKDKGPFRKPFDGT